MLQRPSFSLLLLTMAACIVGGPGLAAAQKSNAPPVQIEVISVTATNSAIGIDPQLKKMPFTKILPSMFGYTSYHMDSRQMERTVCGRILTFILPAGRLIHIAPLTIDGNRVNMEIDMFEGDRQRIDMHLTMENRSTLILGGPHYQLGMLIVMVKTGIVGSLPPAPPRVTAKPPKGLPQDGALPGAAKVPQMVPSAPHSLDGVSPISAHP